MTTLLLLIQLVLLAIVIANIVHLRRTGPSQTSRRPKLSILIPARDEADNLRRLFSSLENQIYPDFEVIVYDDESSDDTWSLLQSDTGFRLIPIHGGPLPPGWIGKVHALAQAKEQAGGEVFLFLDADAELSDEHALERMVDAFNSLPVDTVLTGLPHLRGQGLLLVLMVPNAILLTIPWAVVRKVTVPYLSWLNGQCWMIDAELYRRHEPHLEHKDAILEDVTIGRYLASKGIRPVLVDLRDEVSVFMYRSFRSAWNGFRKNAYLLIGGNAIALAVSSVAYFLVFVAAPFFSPWLLVTIYLMKASTDRIGRFPWWVTLFAPLSYLLGLLLQLDSAMSHWLGRVHWKGRSVGRS